MNDQLRERIAEIINNDENYKKRYEEGELFTEIIDGILNSEKCVESMVDALYSYNEMFTSIVNTIAKDMDEKTVQDSISMFEETLNDNKE